MNKYVRIKYNAYYCVPLLITDLGKSRTVSSSCWSRARCRSRRVSRMTCIYATYRRQRFRFQFFKRSFRCYNKIKKKKMFVF